MATTRYGEIADALRARIADGRYPVGTKLPGITQLMTEFHVKGLNTVRQAQQLLVGEGLLRTEQGVGAWVIARHSDTLAARQILEDLRDAQAAIGRAITHLQRQPTYEAKPAKGRRSRGS